MRLFHRIDGDDKLKPVYIRTSDIQAITPASTTGCSVYVRDGLHFRIAESAEEVLEACGYGVEVTVNADATLILAGALRAEHLVAKEDSDMDSETIREGEYKRGYTNGLKRAIEIAEGKP